MGAKKSKLRSARAKQRRGRNRAVRKKKEEQLKKEGEALKKKEAELKKQQELQKSRSSAIESAAHQSKLNEIAREEEMARINEARKQMDIDDKKFHAQVSGREKEYQDSMSKWNTERGQWIKEREQRTTEQTKLQTQVDQAKERVNKLKTELDALNKEVSGHKEFKEKWEKKRLSLEEQLGENLKLIGRLQKQIEIVRKKIPKEAARLNPPGRGTQGFAIGGENDDSFVEIYMTDKVRSYNARWTRPALKENTKTKIKIQVKKVKKGREIVVWVDKERLETKTFPIVGDIYGGTNGGLFGEMSGWKFEGKVHKVSVKEGITEEKFEEELGEYGKEGQKKEGLAGQSKLKKNQTTNFMEETPCLPACHSKYGRCVNGVCICGAGYSGPTCNNPPEPIVPTREEWIHQTDEIKRLQKIKDADGMPKALSYGKHEHKKKNSSFLGQLNSVNNELDELLDNVRKQKELEGREKKYLPSEFLEWGMQVPGLMGKTYKRTKHQKPIDVDINIDDRRKIHFRQGKKGAKLAKLNAQPQIIGGQSKENFVNPSNSKNYL